MNQQTGVGVDTIVVEQHVDAAPDAVWDVITDLENAAEVMSGISKVERLDSGAGFDVGFTWRETRRMFGKEATEEMTVVAIDEGHSYDVEADSHGTRYHSTMSVGPDGDGSRLRMTFRGEAHSSFSKVMSKTVGRLFQGPTRKAIQQDLKDIAETVEQRV